MSDEGSSGAYTLSPPPRAASPGSSFPEGEGSHLGVPDLFGATGHDSRPRTPEHQMDQLHDAYTPTASPPLPSPMSFYHLGIGPPPLSPFRRQFSSGLNVNFSRAGSAENAAGDRDGEMSSGDDPTEDDRDSQLDDLTQDRKDVLLDRLNDLVQRLSSGGNVQEASIDSLHAKVDEMEQVLSGDSRATRLKKPRRPPLSGMGSLLSSPPRPTEPDERDLRAPATPDWLAPRFSEVARTSTGGNSPISLRGAVDNAGEGTKISAEAANQLAVEAQKLCDKLAGAFSSLQARREESEHLSEMLIERAEGAAKRLLELEDDISKLEDELGGNESELKHLRLRLRAVEVMCYEYVPADADPELLESIENWKSDWATLKKKMTAKRRERNPHAEENSALSTPSASILLESPRFHRSRPLAND